MPAIITRKAALARSIPRYFTGEPCKRGHISARRAADGKCVACESSRKRNRSIEREQSTARPSTPACGLVTHLKPYRRKSVAEMVAERAANPNPDPEPIRQGGAFRERGASLPDALFSAADLALADLWAQRFVEDAERVRNGLKPIYPDLESWERRGGKAANLMHVSGKKLGETTLTDLTLGTLAAYRAAEIMAEAEAA